MLIFCHGDDSIELSWPMWPKYFSEKKYIMHRLVWKIYIYIMHRLVTAIIETINRDSTVFGNK